MKRSLSLHLVAKSGIKVTNRLQKMNKDKDMSDQRVREMEGSLGLAMQALRDMDTKIQGMSINQPKIMENNLTKAKRALITPKRL